MLTSSRPPFHKRSDHEPNAQHEAQEEETVYVCGRGAISYRCLRPRRRLPCQAPHTLEMLEKNGARLASRSIPGGALPEVMGVLAHQVCRQLVDLEGGRGGERLRGEVNVQRFSHLVLFL
jgi:hypothetical protein